MITLWKNGKCYDRFTCDSIFFDPSYVKRIVTETRRELLKKDYINNLLKKEGVYNEKI